MKTDKILSFLFGVKKSKFEIADDELDIISKGIDPDEPTEVLDLDTYIKNHVENDAFLENESNFDEFLHTIFLEAKEKSDLKVHDLSYVVFNTLDSYNELLEKNHTFKRGFICFLEGSINLKTKDRASSDHISKQNCDIPNSFRLAILNLLLKTKVSLLEADLILLLDFWKSSYRLRPDLKSILRQLQNFVDKNPLSPELASFLESFLRSKAITSLDLDYYMHTESILRRILLSKSRKIFLLLPGHFGSYTNQKINELSSETKYNFSKILKTFCQESLDDEKTQEKINYYINKIGIETWNQLTLDLLRRGMNFITSYITLHYAYIGSADKNYITPKPMHKENLKILNGLVMYSGIYKNRESILCILKILERSFLGLHKYGYGPTSRTLGKSCTHVLANHFGEEGRNILVDLYYETKFKTIKKQIEQESKLLLESTGISLI